MKKTIIIIIVAISLFFAGGFLYAYFFESQTLSPDQEEIVETFGYPKRFSISYVPRGEGENVELVRKEEWVYPSHQKEISFLAGEVFSLDEISEVENLTYSDLKPEDFVFFMGYAEVAAKLNSEIEKVDMIPELFIEGKVETYISDHVFFTIEHGHLTYLETVGIEEGEE